ncbi:MAG: cytochrome c biogenesis CcdA family protein [Marinosulfonomonas sp.]|nr:cytochrome c biogenesis CcdA family protein [Marinosulfonomonas sp.]
MELIFAYGAGLLTLINPCVLPILPIILASSVQTNRHGPLAVAAGMSTSFVILGMLLTVLGRTLGINEDTIVNTGAVLMIVFGLVLLVPRLSAGFATATAGFASGANASIDNIDQSGLRGQFLIGILMGAVWSPCIGPTLGAAIGLASQGESLIFAASIMLFFAFGVSTIILALGYGARSVIVRRREWMRAVAEKSRPLMGGVFVLVGLGILFHLPRYAEAWLINNLPTWLIDLSVSI